MGNLSRVTIDRPFTDGYVSDLPVEHLGPRQAALLENMIFPRGVAERRHGWQYHGANQVPVGQTTRSVARVAFKRTGLTQTVMQGSGGESFVAGNVIIPGIGGPLPRCVYRDELILCHQDGVTPLKRYAGAPAGATTATYTGSSPAAGDPTLSTPTPLTSAQAGPGMFVEVNSRLTGGRVGPRISWRVARAVAGESSVALERFAGSGSSYGFSIMPWGRAAPCVPIQANGLWRLADGTMNSVLGKGTSWATGVPPVLPGDGITAVSGFNGDTIAVSNVLSDSSLVVVDLNTPGTDWMPMRVLRHMPFRDAAVFRGCFFGSGVVGQESRLYYFPPGADIGLPPRWSTGPAAIPHDSQTSAGPDGVLKDLEMEYMEVPSHLDSDPIVALLPTDNALLVLKRGSVYRVTGDYPNWRSDKAMTGAGCVDIRSAVTDDAGVFWAGADGIWTLRGGYPVNLAGGNDRPGILTEWRNLMAEGVAFPADVTGGSYVSLGVSNRHLVVSVRTLAGTMRTFVMDLVAGRWCGRFTNFAAQQMWSSSLAGEADMLLAGMGQRVANLAPAFANGLGRDENNVTYLAKAHTGSSVFVPGLQREHRLVDLRVEAGIGTTGSTPPATAVDVIVAHGDRVDATHQQGVVETVGSITTPTPDTGRSHTREFRPGTRGRQHQVRLEQTAVDQTETRLEFHEIAGNVRMYGDRR